MIPNCVSIDSILAILILFIRHNPQNPPHKHGWVQLTGMSSCVCMYDRHDFAAAGVRICGDGLRFYALYQLTIHRPIYSTLRLRFTFYTWEETVSIGALTCTPKIYPNLPSCIKKLGIILSSLPIGLLHLSTMSPVLAPRNLFFPGSRGGSGIDLYSSIVLVLNLMQKLAFLPSVFKNLDLMFWELLVISRESFFRIHIATTRNDGMLFSWWMTLPLVLLYVIHFIDL
jgi:hypothetical protein